MYLAGGQVLITISPLPILSRHFTITPRLLSLAASNPLTLDYGSNSHSQSLDIVISHMKAIGKNGQLDTPGPPRLLVTSMPHEFWSRLYVTIHTIRLERIRGLEISRRGIDINFFDKPLWQGEVRLGYDIKIQLIIQYGLEGRAG